MVASLHDNNVLRSELGQLPIVTGHTSIFDVAKWGVHNTSCKGAWYCLEQRGHTSFMLTHKASSVSGSGCVCGSRLLSTPAIVAPNLKLGPLMVTITLPALPTLTSYGLRVPVAKVLMAGLLSCTQSPFRWSSGLRVTFGGAPGNGTYEMTPSKVGALISMARMFADVGLSCNVLLSFAS